MKSILISIKPRWCELIASGEKTIEVRKTRPKIDAPFKVYIYATKAKDWLLYRDEYFGIGLLHATGKGNHNTEILSGKVIGEFVCDEIYVDRIGDLTDYFERCGCVTRSELIEYAGSKTIFGWHISDLVIYDKPKTLSDFRTPWTSRRKSNAFVMSHKIDRAPQSWCFVEEVL